MNEPTHTSDYAVMVPELGMPGVAIVVSVWLVPLGARVLPGDRVVELLAGDATVDLVAPVQGVLSERHAGEDDVVMPGQVLGLVRSREN